ncbi:hypothetical protein PQG02_37290 (plasmid) [Nostoc sp. UHCC 0926]|nr:hypothetical protein [Nostoc sp. UHCC 0926]WDD36743.1 hypothetical protein PQG02_37290 [Nostoc sp. UHCC 0926]
MEAILKSIAVPPGVSKSPQVLPEEAVNASPDFDADISQSKYMRSLG